MRAVVVKQPGGPSALGVLDVPAPDPGPGELLVRVAWAAANWGDVQKRQGVYPDPQTYPLILGAEVSGVVAAVGQGVSNRWLGRPVSALCGPMLRGGQAEWVCVPLAYVLRVPPSVALDVAAAFPIAMLTAYHLLHSAYRLRPGETVLVHAASGSVGLAVVQVARLAGATVIGTVGRAAKAEIAYQHGAGLVIDRSREDFVERVLRFTAGRGVDLVIDSLGADVLPRSFDALRVYGHLINIGEAAGEPEFAVRKKLYERSTSFAGFELLHAAPGSPRWRRGVRFVTRGMARGELRMPIGHVFPLEEVARAHEVFESRSGAGKVLLELAGTRVE